MVALRALFVEARSTQALAMRPAHLLGADVTTRVNVWLFGPWSATVTGRVGLRVGPAWTSPGASWPLAAQACHLLPRALAVGAEVGYQQRSQETTLTSVLDRSIVAEVFITWSPS